MIHRASSAFADRRAIPRTAPARSPGPVPRRCACPTRSSRQAHDEAKLEVRQRACDRHRGRGRAGSDHRQHRRCLWSARRDSRHRRVGCRRRRRDRRGGARATGGGGGATVDAPCQGPSDCDSTSYCLADDQDCGPGHCVKRPPDHGDPSPDFYCGCDGVVYATPDEARAMGVDVGSNNRCKVDPGDFFLCGSQVMCRGSGKCCGSDGAACGFEYYCVHYDRPDSPGGCAKALLEPTGYDPFCECDLKCLLDGWCNSTGVQPPFTSVTCQELCNGEYMIECK